MILAIVQGTVVSTNKTIRLRGSKLLIIKEWHVTTEQRSQTMNVAVDIVGAGIGELVLCVSGSSARQTDETDKKPVDLTIIGIVDQVELGGEMIYIK